MENLNTIKRLIAPFIEEILPEGGIDMTKSLWQKPGRGYGGIFPHHPDVRYVAAFVKLLYDFYELTGNRHYHDLANKQARFIAHFASEKEPMWLLGTALQAIGLYSRFNNFDDEMLKNVHNIIAWAHNKKIPIDAGTVTFGHFPCGYGLMGSKDAGWTNDLSVFGSGLVFGYEATKQNIFLEDAVSYAEYFVQPWVSGSMGEDGYWHAGTWRDDIGSWVIGPYHYSGIEGTNGFTDEISWVFSSFSCIDYLTHLYSLRPDPRYLSSCLKAAKWTFETCMFEDGAVGLCTKDDKWYGCTGYAISQVYKVAQLLEAEDEKNCLLENARKTYEYLIKKLPSAKFESNGVEWVTRTTLDDPMVNVGWLWLNAMQGLIDGQRLFKE